MEKDFVSVGSVTSIFVEFKNGVWQANYTVSQRKLETPDGEWKEVKIESNAVSGTFEGALEDAMETIGRYMNRVGGDLFAKLEDDNGKSITSL